VAINRKDILQVQYTKEWSMHHLSIYGTEKTLCGKPLGIALELFDIPLDVCLENCCHCKSCLKALKKLTIE
jgi:hypothetical protein